MATQPRKPVILLAFANARVDGEQFLRNLPEELRRILDTLRVAQAQDLCETVSLANATVEQVFDTFQDAAYRDRIAVFHYGGHANSFQLLLETKDRGTQPAAGKGLAAFLGAQRGLQLVFLNGCSTRLHAEKLLECNVPTVIATSRAINDEVAMRFAARFYRGLASGADIERAYHEAAAESQSVSTGDLRNFYVVNEVGPVDSDHWPWQIHIKEGAEKTFKWSLPDAVGNPLFGLPPLPELDLPAKPFFYLDSFTREQAQVFFGRGHQIRELYERVTDRYSAPILLFYGQTGVGKSSLLAAGLLPRLEGAYEIHYCRRDDEAGLLRTLARVLGTKEDTSIGDAWRQFEKDTGKEVILILDQVEETFSRLKGDSFEEFKEFLSALETVFAIPATRPKGKLILGFRKEWIAEVEEGLRDRKLPHSKVFLEHLDRDGIIEAVTGITRNDRLRSHFGLTIADRLPELIADDLLEDEESPIAPTLQILLTKLWEKASEENGSRPVIDTPLYLKLKEEGLLVSDFVDQQLAKAKAELGVAESSGLVLDILAFHTTELGTARQRKAEEVESEYQSQSQGVHPVKWITDSLKDLYLLADASPDQHAGDATRLSHDILAPLVRARFEKSLLPGQKARRILENRAVEWKENGKGGILYDDDLTVIKKGEIGMRAFKPEEIRLLEASNEASAKRRRFNRFLKLAALTVVLAFVVFAVNFVRQGRQETYRSQLDKAQSLYEKARIEWETNRNLLASLVLVVKAINTVPDDRTDLIGTYQETAFLLSMNAPSAVTDVTDSDDSSHVRGGFFSPTHDKLILISDTKVRALKITETNMVETLAVPVALNNKSPRLVTSGPGPVFSSTGDWFAFLTRTNVSDYQPSQSNDLQETPSGDIQDELLRRERGSAKYPFPVYTYDVCAWHIGTEDLICESIKPTFDPLSLGINDCEVTLVANSDSFTVMQITLCASTNHKAPGTPQTAIHQFSIAREHKILSSILSPGGERAALLVKVGPKNEADLQVWDTSLGQKVFAAPVGFTLIKGFNAEFSRFLLTGDGRQNLCVYSTTTRSCESNLKGDENGTWSQAMFGVDQNSVISISDGSVRFWNTSSGTAGNGYVVPLASLSPSVSSNGKTLRLLSEPNFLSNSLLLLTWDLTEDVFKRFRLDNPFEVSYSMQAESPNRWCLGSERHLAYASFTPDQKSVLALSYEYDLPNFRDQMKLELLTLTTSGTNSVWTLDVPETKVTTSSDGRYFATITKERAVDSIKSTIHICDVNTGKVCKTLPVNGDVSQLVFNEQASRIAVEVIENSEEKLFVTEQLDIATGTVIPSTHSRPHTISSFSKYGDFYISSFALRSLYKDEPLLRRNFGWIGTTLFQQAPRIEIEGQELYAVFDENMIPIENDPYPWLNLFQASLTARINQREGRNPVWAPDGYHVAYVSKSLTKVFTDSYDRSGLFQRDWLSVSPVANFTFTPDGKRLLVITNDGRIQALHLTSKLSPLGSTKKSWVTRTALALTGLRYFIRQKEFNVGRSLDNVGTLTSVEYEAFEPISPQDYLRAREQLILELRTAVGFRDDRASLLLERLTSTN